MKRTLMIAFVAALTWGLMPVQAQDSTATEGGADEASEEMMEGGTEVGVAEAETYGSYLVDAEGKALYLFMADTDGTSTCNGDCAGAWPPLTTEGEPTAGDGAEASMLGTTEREDGTMQVTYNGQPLYYFVRDESAGDTNGQAVEGFGAEWYLVSPSGEQVEGEK